MTVPSALALVMVVVAFYAATVAYALLRDAVQVERSRRRNGPIRILSRGYVRRFAVALGAMILFQVEGVVLVTLQPGQVAFGFLSPRAANVVTNIAIAIIFVYWLRSERASWAALLRYDEPDDAPRRRVIDHE